MKPKTNLNSFDILQYDKYLIIAIPLLVYFPVLHLGFVYFDDDVLILSNYSKLTNISNIWLAFRTDAFFANLSPYYRPFMNVSFMFDAMIGGKSPGIYHFSNLLYHILTCLGLFTLLNLLGFRKYPSLLATILFSIHPAIGHAVMWIPARGDILVTLFSILSLVFLLKYLNKKNNLYLLIHIVCFISSLFSKESGIFIPLFFILVLWLKKEKLLDRNKIILYLFWLIAVCVWYYLRHITIDHRPDIQRGINPLFQNFAFLPEAIARLFFPFNLPVTPIFSYNIIILGSAITIILLVYCVKTWNPSKMPMIVFGITWFLCICFPNMYVRLSSAEDSFEYLLHRLYLPSIGFTIFMLIIMPENSFNRNSNKHKIFVAAILISFIVYDFYQQKTYKNAVNFWTASINYAPNKSWLYYHMSQYYSSIKDLKNSELLLLKADSIKSYPLFKYNLAMFYYTERKDYEKSHEYFKTAFNHGYNNKEANDNFTLFCIESAYDYFKRNEYDKAINRCQIAINNDPLNAVAYYNMGIYLISKGNKSNAASMWRKAITLSPEIKEAYKSLSLYYQYDVPNSDSAVYFFSLYKKYGGQ